MEDNELKNVQVQINPTEIKSVAYNNNFSNQPGTQIKLSVKNETNIKLNPTNPVAAVVMLRCTCEDENKSISFVVETITGVVSSTFVDNFDQLIQQVYLPSIIMASNEKIRSVSSLVGMPIRIPNPVFGKADEKKDESIPQ